jgi:hypothetical protein
MAIKMGFAKRILYDRCNRPSFNQLWAPCHRGGRMLPGTASFPSFDGTGYAALTPAGAKTRMGREAKWGRVQGY